MTELASQSRPWTGRQVVLGFVAFFLVLIAVQAAFIAIAVSTHTGLVSQQPYRKGLNYGERIAQSEQQEKLGWRDEVSLSENRDRLTFRVFDKNNDPVRNLVLTAMLSRPVHKNEDLTLNFYIDNNGDYVADLGSAKAGAFIFDVSAKQHDDVVWRARRRLWIKP